MPAYTNKNYNNVYDAMQSSVKRLGILQGNLQHVDTVAYKAVNPDSVLFSELMQDMFRDESQGELMETGRSLDMALTSKNAFFLLEGENGPERTRVGNFYLDRNGTIVSHDGKELVVLDKTTEDIKLQDSADIQISPKGEILVSGELYGRIAIDYDHRKAGEVAYIAQGKLETSNVDTNTTFMNIIQIKRHVDTLPKHHGNGDDS